MRVLWADDQIDAVTTFAGVLKNAGYSVDFAGSGEEALLRLRELAFDLLLLDLAMPPGRWGGIWLLGKIKEQAIQVPVIVVSGEGSQAETIEALRLGAADYVLKERLEEELVGQISAIVADAQGTLERNVRQLIAGGESETLELKSTLRWSVKANKPDPSVELAVFKTIAAFLNSGGGTLIVGIADSGDVVGIAADRFENADKFQLHFWNRVRDALGPACIPHITARVVTLGADQVFRVDCRKSEEPVYVQWKEGDSKTSDAFFVRAGPRTERLGLKDAVLYINKVFSR